MPLFDSCNHSKDGHTANAVSSHATNAFHLAALADAEAPAASGTAPALSSLGDVPRYACRTGRWLPSQRALCGAEADLAATWTSIVSPGRDSGVLERDAAIHYRPRLALGPTARTETAVVQTGMPSMT